METRIFSPHANQDYLDIGFESIGLHSESNLLNYLSDAEPRLLWL